MKLKKYFILAILCAIFGFGIFMLYYGNTISPFERIGGYIASTMITLFSGTSLLVLLSNEIKK